MNFELTEEQVALKDAVKDFFTAKSTSQVVRNSMEDNAGFNSSIYESMRNEIGLTSLIIDEVHGGFGASDLELNIVMEQHGYFLVPSPLRAHSYASILVQECASEAVKTELLPILSEGSEIASVAFDGFDKVLFSNIAKHLFFVDDAKLFHIDLEQEGIEKIAQNSVDPTQPIGIVNFDKSKANLISDGDISQSYKIATARMTILLANEMLGAATKAYDMALQYSKEREQFSRPIGSFQVIKHRLVDMYLEIEKAKSLCLYAACISSIRNDELLSIASMAKAFMSNIFKHITEENIQIHGGIGFTYEHDAHLFFKRAIFNAFELGGESHHIELIAEEIFN